MTRRWPLRPPPQPDELLISWLVRLAAAYGVSLDDFAKCLLGVDLVRDRGPLARLKTLSECERLKLTTTLVLRAGVTASQVRRLFAPEILAATELRADSAWFWGDPNQSLKFCPICLHEDARPYFRRHWQLTIMAACPRHGATLIDTCPACGGTVLPHRHARRVVPIDECDACGESLGRTAGNLASAQTVAIAGAITKGITSGTTSFGGLGRVHIVLFLRLLRLVTLLVGTYDRAGIELIEPHRPAEFPQPLFPERRWDFPTLPLAVRAALLDYAADALVDWPTRWRTFLPEPLEALRLRLEAAALDRECARHGVPVHGGPPWWDLNRLLGEVAPYLPCDHNLVVPFDRIIESWAETARARHPDLARWPHDDLEKFVSRYADNHKLQYFQARCVDVVDELRHRATGIDLSEHPRVDWGEASVSVRHPPKQRPSPATRDAAECTSPPPQRPSPAPRNGPEHAPPPPRQSRPQSAAPWLDDAKRWADQKAKHAVLRSWGKFVLAGRSGRRELIGRLARDLAAGAPRLTFRSVALRADAEALPRAS